MPLSLAIKPFSNSLNLFGDADPSFAFSLAGYVSASVTSPPSTFGRRRTTTQILLQSLTVTFEGQSEVITPETGYAPLRLCSFSRELLTDGPINLSNEGHEESDEPCSWDVTFDIRVPGWLPTTSVFGDAATTDAGTRYALYATATFAYLGGGGPVFSLCVPFYRSRVHTVHAPKFPITLRRTVEPSTRSSCSSFPMSLYVIDAQPDTPGGHATSFRAVIPPEILRKIDVVACVPSAVAMCESSMPFVLRLRADALSESEREALRVTEFSVDLEQIEIYRNTQCRDQIARYPVPSPDQQPPTVPLRDPHPIHTLYDAGLLFPCQPLGPSINRSFSLLPHDESGRYVIAGDGHVFTSGDASNPDASWYILEINVPIVQECLEADWAGPRVRRTTESSPLFSVQHFIHVSIRCTFDHPDTGEMAHERLHFSIPLRHVEVPQVFKPVTAFEGVHVSRLSMNLQKSLPYAQILPAYSQLFHSNGERKIDHSIPLPVYEPPLDHGMDQFKTHGEN